MSARSQGAFDAHSLQQRRGQVYVVFVSVHPRPFLPYLFFALSSFIVFALYYHIIISFSGRLGWFGGLGRLGTLRETVPQNLARLASQCVIWIP